MDEQFEAVLASDELFMAEQFCSIMVPEKRNWFVVNELFKGHKHTLRDWVQLVSKHDIAVNLRQKQS